MGLPIPPSQGEGEFNAAFSKLLWPLVVVGGLPLDVVKLLVPMLVMGTKEKNAAVKSFSEQALVSLLRLRQDDSVLTVRIIVSLVAAAAAAK